LLTQSLPCGAGLEFCKAKLHYSNGKAGAGGKAFPLLGLKKGVTFALPNYKISSRVTPAFANLSNLPPMVITVKNGHQRKVYVKIDSPDHAGKGGKVEGKKEPWDGSSRKAKELKMVDFGTPQEVANMATMPKTAKTKDKARTVMEEIQAKGVMTNKNNPALKATLSKTSINKILNNKAKNQSFNEEAHLLAAVNVDRLFFNAIEPWKFDVDPRKQNIQLSNRRFLGIKPLRHE
jgi:hypothetical protein